MQPDEFPQVRFGFGPGCLSGACDICMMQIQVEEGSATHTECKNTFHTQCLSTWSETQSRLLRPTTCPKCRTPLNRPNVSDSTELPDFEDFERMPATWMPVNRPMAPPSMQMYGAPVARIPAPRMAVYPPMASPSMQMYGAPVARIPAPRMAVYPPMASPSVQMYGADIRSSPVARLPSYNYHNSSDPREVASLMPGYDGMLSRYHSYNTGERLEYTYGGRESDLDGQDIPRSSDNHNRDAGLTGRVSRSSAVQNEHADHGRESGEQGESMPSSSDNLNPYARSTRSNAFSLPHHLLSRHSEAARSRRGTTLQPSDVDNQRVQQRRPPFFGNARQRRESRSRVTETYRGVNAITRSVPGNRLPIGLTQRWTRLLTDDDGNDGDDETGC